MRVGGPHITSKNLGTLIDAAFAENPHDVDPLF